MSFLHSLENFAESSPIYSFILLISTYIFITSLIYSLKMKEWDKYKDYFANWEISLNRTIKKVIKVTTPVSLSALLILIIYALINY